jgi:hypothetical protein
MLRARQDKALEVWVGGGRALAGWLTNYKNVPMTMRDILISLDRLVGPDDWLQEARGFKLTPAHQVLSSVDLVRYGDAWRDERIPAYATGHKPLNADRIEYSWRVLRLDQDEFDWLFDHPDFVPVDTVKDRDFLTTDEGIADYFSERMKDDLMDAMIFGSVSTYAAAATSTLTSASSGSASDSTMTLETLQKSIAAVQRAMGRR